MSMENTSNASAIGQKENERTFILGLGANFSGMKNIQTEWEKAGCADFGIRQEYRVLHVYDGDLSKGPPSNLYKRALDGLTRKNRNAVTSNDALLASFALNPSSYFDYFSRILNRNSIVLSGDFCDSYSRLSANTFELVQTEFAARSIRVIPVYFVRNPIYRMHEQVLRKFNEAKMSPNYSDVAEVARAFVGSEEDYHFTDYGEKIRTLRHVLGDRLAVVPVEAFQNEWALHELQMLLGVPVPLITRKVPDGKRKTLAFTEADYRDFQEAYADVFDCVDRELDAFDIDALWKFFP